MANGGAAPQLFVGRGIPLVLCSAVLGLAGVLAVDLYIEHRQIKGSTIVAESTILTLRQVGEVSGALDRYEEAAAYAAPDEPSALGALRRSRERLVSRMREFDEHVGAVDLTAWQGVRERIDANSLERAPSRAAAEDRIRSLQEDLSSAAILASRSGIDNMSEAERLHTLHGVLEALVLLLTVVVSLALLFRWREQELQARARDARVVEQLRRTLADLDGFAGRLAHDLRAPLQPILIGSQTIERAAESDLVRTHAERIARSARRIGRMCEVLMQYARLSRGAAHEGAPVWVNAEVQEVVAELDEKAIAGGASMTTDLGVDFGLACPSEVVHSLVSNLVDNALKYGKKKGASARVIVRTRVEGSRGVIEVEDEGPGISPELREQVFEPLFRSQKGGEGVGLGLAIVQRLVESLGGHIEVRAGEKGGALFRIVLPTASTSRDRPTGGGDGT